MSLLDTLIGLFQTAPSTQKCETCSHQMQVLDSSNRGAVMLSREDLTSGIGQAEQCWECGRLYCADCYPSRPPNTCVCGQGRSGVRHIDGTVYHGSLRLVKVRYRIFGSSGQENLLELFENPQTAIVAFREIRKLDSPEAVSLLLAGLQKHTSSCVRAGCLTTLSSYELDKAAIGAVIAALDDDSAEVRSAAAPGRRTRRARSAGPGRSPAARAD
jgi:hypothetical protein